MSQLTVWQTRLWVAWVLLTIPVLMVDIMHATFNAPLGWKTALVCALVAMPLVRVILSGPIMAVTKKYATKNLSLSTIKACYQRGRLSYMMYIAIALYFSYFAALNTTILVGVSYVSAVVVFIFAFLGFFSFFNAWNFMQTAGFKYYMLRETKL